jgi:N-methylhydantoinase B
VQGPDDVWEVAWCAGGGYGDPLQREPQRVADDVREGRVTAAWAREAYGVCFVAEQPPFVLDHDATAALRATRLAPAQRVIAGGRQLADTLELHGKGAQAAFRCSRCGHALGPAHQNYKHATRLEETAITAANPHIADPAHAIDAQLVLRRYHCPGCGVIIETEIARAGEPLLWDIELA